MRDFVRKASRLALVSLSLLTLVGCDDRGLVSPGAAKSILTSVEINDSLVESLMTFGDMKAVLSCPSQAIEVPDSDAVLVGNSIEITFRPKENISGVVCFSKIVTIPSEAMLEAFNFAEVGAEGRVSLLISGSGKVDGNKLDLNFFKSFSPKVPINGAVPIALGLNVEGIDVQFASLNLKCDTVEANIGQNVLISTTPTIVEAMVESAVTSEICEATGVTNNGEVFKTDKIIEFGPSDSVAGGFASEANYVLRLVQPPVEVNGGGGGTDTIIINGDISTCPADKVVITPEGAAECSVIAPPAADNEVVPVVNSAVEDSPELVALKASLAGQGADTSKALSYLIEDASETITINLTGGRLVVSTVGAIDDRDVDTEMPAVTSDGNGIFTILYVSTNQTEHELFFFFGKGVGSVDEEHYLLHFPALDLFGNVFALQP